MMRDTMTRKRDAMTKGRDLMTRPARCYDDDKNHLSTGWKKGLSRLFLCENAML